MQRRRELMGMQTSGLPSEYRKVEYLESDGTQWIDTGIVPNVYTWARLKFVNLVTTGDVIFGFFNTELTSWRLFNASNANYLDLPSNVQSTYRYITGTESSIQPGCLIELEIGNKYKKILLNYGWPKELINTDYYSTPIDSFATVTKTLTLNYYSPSKISLNRWYYVKIYNGNVQVRNMIPCVRKSDSKPGMYDTVSKTFYTNAGTGEFIVPA